MAIEDDRKRGQILTGVGQLKFTDSEMLRVLADGFSFERCRVQASRLIADAETVQRKYSNRADAEMSDEDAAIVAEGKKASELLYLIEKPIN